MNRGMLRGALAAAFVAACAGLPSSAFAAGTAADVVADLRAHPTQVLAAPLGDEAPGNGAGKVLGYPLGNVARVAVDGQQGYVVSSVPLAVGGKPLSFGLEARGGTAAPAAAPIDVEVDLSSGAFDLAAPGGPAVRVRRLGDRRPSDASIVAGRAIVSGTDEAADSVLQATGRGIESFEVLRSDAASPVIRWQVSLPNGWSLEAAPGNTAVLLDRGGKVAYRVSAPWARDAAGESLALALSVEGPDVIKVETTVDKSTTYPVVVDPDWASTYDFAAGSGAAGWFQINEPVPGQPALGYTSSFTSVGGLAGLLIWPTGSNAAQYVNVGGDGQEVRGGTRFEAPGTTRIKRIDFGDTMWELRQEDCSAGTYRDVDQYLRFVLRNRDTDATVDELQIGGPGGTGSARNTATPTSVPLLDPNAGAPSSTSASITMWTEARTTAAPKWIFPNPRPIGAGCDDAVSPFVRVGRVDITLVDSDTPIIDEVSGQIRDWAQSAQSAWINGNPGDTRKATGTVRMHDAGAGLDLGGDNDPDRPGSREPTAFIRATNQFGKSVPFDLSGGQRCDAQHQNAAAEGRICPEAITTQFTPEAPLDLGELVGPNVPPGERDGPWDLRADVADLVGHQASLVPAGGWRFFVDTMPPAVNSLSINDEAGNDLRNRWIRASAADAAAGGEVRLVAEATDPVAGSVASGVRHIGLRWRDGAGTSRDLIPLTELQCDDALVATQPISAPCPRIASPDHRTIPRHLASGQYVASADATDFAGNGPGTAAEASTWVDSTPPEVAFSGTLADLDGAWIAPTEPASIDVTATDPGPHASGIRNARLTFTAGNGLEVEPSIDLASCNTQPGAGSPTPPAPLCPTPGSGSAQVDTASWPHGRVDVTVDAEDAVGNRTPKADADVVVQVDRRAPEVSVTGELATVAAREGWVIPAGNLTTVVDASDEGAGIARLQVWAKDEQGTRLIEERQVCTPPAQTVGDEPPCPLEVTEEFELDPSAVGDGTATFEVRAIEYTGRIARVRETVKLDGTPPPPVEGLKIERILMTATASWERPEVPAESSPIVGYEYAFVPAGQTNVVWTTTPSTSVPLPELPAGVAAELYVCALEASGNRSACRNVSDRGFTSFGVNNKQPPDKKKKKGDRDPEDETDDGCYTHRWDAHVLPSGVARATLIAECPKANTLRYMFFGVYKKGILAKPFLVVPAKGKAYTVRGPSRSQPSQVSRAFGCPAGETVRVRFSWGVRLPWIEEDRALKCPDKPESTAKCAQLDGGARDSGKPYVVYRGYTNGEITYVGITKQTLAARCGQHRREGRIWSQDIRQMRFRRTFTKEEAIGIEQTLQNYYGRRVRPLNKNFDTDRIPDAYGPLYNFKDELPSAGDVKEYCAGIKRGHIMIRSHAGKGSKDPDYQHFRVPNYPRRNCG